jgi:hypothetical protein
MSEESENSEDSNTEQPTDRENNMLMALATQMKR